MKIHQRYRNGHNGQYTKLKLIGNSYKNNDNKRIATKFWGFGAIFFLCETKLIIHIIIIDANITLFSVSIKVAFAVIRTKNKT